MAPQIRKAERRKAKLRLGICATAGAGKTYSALLLAFGLGGKVGMIDTEYGSGDLYAHLGDYDIIAITAPYTVAKYREAIKAFEDNAYNVIIIDSLTHAWAGEGGLLDKQGKIADSSRTGNSYTAWRTVTPEHNLLIGDMLASPCHIIATMRSKTEYVQEKDTNGKTIIRKVGLAPVQREGMDFEFTVVLDISADHIAYASKNRTAVMTDEYFKPSIEHGKKFLEWLESGAEPEKPKTKEQDDRAAYNEEKTAFIVPVLTSSSGEPDYETFAADYEGRLEHMANMNEVSMLKKANAATLNAIKSIDTALFEHLKTVTGAAGNQFM